MDLLPHHHTREDMVLPRAMVQHLHQDMVLLRVMVSHLPQDMVHHPLHLDMVPLQLMVPLKVMVNHNTHKNISLNTTINLSQNTINLNPNTTNLLRLNTISNLSSTINSLKSQLILRNRRSDLI